MCARYDVERMIKGILSLLLPSSRPVSFLSLVVAMTGPRTIPNLCVSLFFNCPLPWDEAVCCTLICKPGFGIWNTFPLLVNFLREYLQHPAWDEYISSPGCFLYFWHFKVGLWGSGPTSLQGKWPWAWAPGTLKQLGRTCYGFSFISLVLQPWAGQSSGECRRGRGSVFSSEWATITRNSKCKEEKTP